MLGNTSWGDRLLRKFEIPVSEVSPIPQLSLHVCLKLTVLVKKVHFKVIVAFCNEIFSSWPQNTCFKFAFTLHDSYKKVKLVLIVFVCLIPFLEFNTKLKNVLILILSFPSSSTSSLLPPSSYFLFLERTLLLPFS